MIRLSKISIGWSCSALWKLVVTTCLANWFLQEIQFLVSERKKTQHLLKDIAKLLKTWGVVVIIFHPVWAVEICKVTSLKNILLELFCYKWHQNCLNYLITFQSLFWIFLAMCIFTTDSNFVSQGHYRIELSRAAIT